MTQSLAVTALNTINTRSHTKRHDIAENLPIAALISHLVFRSSSSQLNFPLKCILEVGKQMAGSDNSFVSARNTTKKSFEAEHTTFANRRILVEASCSVVQPRKKSHVACFCNIES
jgi:hypothetical protein